MARPVLDKDKLELCNKLLKACNETKQYLELCKDCELAVEEEIAQNDEQMRIVAKIKAKHFPNAK